jgi:mRNA interferase HigB
MRLITRRRLRTFARRHPDTQASLEAWRRVTEAAEWGSIDDLRRDFPTADGVQVMSGRVATVFNIRGNKFRLITAIHYNRELVYVMRFYTHAEYGRGRWKDIL